MKTRVKQKNRQTVRNSPSLSQKKLRKKPKDANSHI